jgi:hypothetical protein
MPLRCSSWRQHRSQGFRFQAKSLVHTWMNTARTYRSYQYSIPRPRLELHQQYPLYQIAYPRDYQHSLRGSLAYRNSAVFCRTKMSWAASRTTTRAEDIVYCLLGIFNANIPLIYGEGGRAFIRPQEEIIRASSDHTIFAWRRSDDGDRNMSGSILAHSPKNFSKSPIFPCSRIFALTRLVEDFEIQDLSVSRPFLMTNFGVHIHLPRIVNCREVNLWAPKGNKNRVAHERDLCSCIISFHQHYGGWGTKYDADMDSSYVGGRKSVRTYCAQCYRIHLRDVAKRAPGKLKTPTKEDFCR